MKSRKNSDSYEKISEAINQLNSIHNITISVSSNKKSFNYSKEFIRDLRDQLKECSLIRENMSCYVLSETVLWYLMDFYTAQEKTDESDQELEYKQIDDPIRYIVLMFKKIRDGG